MKIDVANLKRISPSPDSRLWQLPEPGLGMLKLLLSGLGDAEFDPLRFDEWRAWHAQGAGRWGALFSRTQVRQLPQDERAWLEVGLSARIQARPTRDPPLQDVGPLARAAAIEWERGLEALLDALAGEPADISMPLVAGAIAHAVECGAESSIPRMVAFAQDAGWAGKDIGLAPGVVARAWMLLVDDDPVPADDAVLDQLVAISGLRPDGATEVEFWKELAKHQEHRSAGHALEAWVKRYPASWDRVNSQALQNPDVPCAWMLACQHAFFHGVETPLFQAALKSESAEQWMPRLDWRQDEDASPLALWWARWVELETTRRRPSRHEAISLPGNDAVSNALRAMGAPEPGSAEDRSLGGKCFAALLRKDEVQVEWFQAHPEWVYEHPRTGSSPLFYSRSHAEFDKWQEVGFDPRAVNRKGNTAAASFLSHSMKNRKRLAAQLCQAFPTGRMPTTGLNDGNPVVHYVARVGEEASWAWLNARLFDPAPLSPLETLHIARHASGYIALRWQAACAKAGQWNDEHMRTLWVGLSSRDMAEDHDAWIALQQAVPLVDDPARPLWVAQFQSEASVQDLARALEFAKSQGALPLDEQHPCWEEEAVCQAFFDGLSDLPPQQAAILVPKEASSQWWQAMLVRWISSDPEAVRSASEMERWLRAGLVLDPPIVEWLARQDRSDASPGFPWWEQPEIAAALSSHALDAQTAPALPRSVSRRF